MKFTAPVPRTVRDCKSEKKKALPANRVSSCETVNEWLNLSTVRLQFGVRPTIRRRRHSVGAITSATSVKVGVRRKRRAVSCPSIKRTLRRNEYTSLQEQPLHIQKKNRTEAAFKSGLVKRVWKETAPATAAPQERKPVMTTFDLALKSVSMQAVFAHKFLNLCDKFESRVNEMLDKMDNSVRNINRRADAAHASRKSIVRVVGQLEDAKKLHSQELCVVGRVVPSAPPSPPLIHHLLEKPSYCYAQLAAY